MKASTLLDNKVDVDPTSLMDDNGKFRIEAVTHLGDGLNLRWAGNVLCVPTGDYYNWLDKAIRERKAGHTANIVCVFPAFLHSGFGQRCIANYPTCILRGYPYIVVYMGAYLQRFDSIFHLDGVIVLAY